MNFVVFVETLAGAGILLFAGASLWAAGLYLFDRGEHRAESAQTKGASFEDRVGREDHEDKEDRRAA